MTAPEPVWRDQMIINGHAAQDCPERVNVMSVADHQPVYVHGDCDGKMKVIGKTIAAVAAAMRAEGCSELTVTRVVNRVLYGEPDGADVVRAPIRDDEQITPLTMDEYRATIPGRMASIGADLSKHLPGGLSFGFAENEAEGPAIR
jgi:hypothetical protein